MLDKKIIYEVLSVVEESSDWKSSNIWSDSPADREREKFSADRENPQCIPAVRTVSLPSCGQSCRADGSWMDGATDASFSAKACDSSEMGVGI